MSLSEVRPYFRARMNYLGYTEWADAFNFENIPESILDKSYHIDANQIRVISFNQADLSIDHSVTLRLFLKGFRTPKDALDSAMIRLDAIYQEVLKPGNRLTGTGGLRNVLLDSTDLQPLSRSNDNAVMVEMNFIAKVHISVCA